MISPLLANIYLDPLDAAMAEPGAAWCGMRTTSSSCAGRARRRTHLRRRAALPASPARVRAAIIGYPYKSGVLRMIDDRKPWLALGMRRDRNSSHETEINFSLLPNFRLAPAPATPQ